MEHRSTVVSVRAQSLRPKYRNLKEWMDDPSNVYIGRSGLVNIGSERFSYEGSRWANPFKITESCSREECILRFEQYIREKIKSEHLEESLLALKGRNLGCWCKPEACHGDVLVRLIDEYSQLAHESAPSLVSFLDTNPRELLCDPSGVSGAQSCASLASFSSRAATDSSSRQAAARGSRSGGPAATPRHPRVDLARGFGGSGGRGSSYGGRVDTPCRGWSCLDPASAAPSAGTTEERRADRDAARGSRGRASEQAPGGAGRGAAAGRLPPAGGAGWAARRCDP